MDTFEGNRQDPLSLHKYLYCHADPVNGVDPSGHLMTMTEIGVAGALSSALALNVYFVAQSVYHRVEVNSLRRDLAQIQQATANLECKEFAERAATLLKRKGKREGVDWSVIIYKNNPGQPVGDYIVAREGFGRFGDGRTAISRNGFHAGIVTTFSGEMRRSLVSDNNVLLETRPAWETGYLLPGRPEGPQGPLYELNLRQAADNGLGSIKVISLSDLLNVRY